MQLPVGMIDVYSRISAILQLTRAIIFLKYVFQDFFYFGFLVTRDPEEFSTLILIGFQNWPFFDPDWSNLGEMTKIARKVEFVITSKETQDIASSSKSRRFSAKIIQ